MNLINIQTTAIGGQQIHTVNARDLHSFLEVGKVFAAWINERIQQYEFIENQDFVIFSNSGKKPTAGRPAKEYALTLDMAKELAMVERNEKGKLARRYFIEAEKALRAAQGVQSLLVEVKTSSPISSFEDQPIYDFIRSGLEGRIRNATDSIVETIRTQIQQQVTAACCHAFGTVGVAQMTNGQGQRAMEWVSRLRDRPILIQLPNLNQVSTLPPGQLPPQARLLREKP